jgi:lipid-binding SYLF domain-containing protein
MSRRNFLAVGASTAALAVLTVSGCTTTGSATADPATRRAAITSGADSALSRLYATNPGSKDLVARAKGVLVFPNVISGGFIVGAAGGDGVLLKGGKPERFFRMSEGSVGLLAGAQSQAVFILFMTDAALASFERSNGWTAGVDGSIALLNVGASANVSTQTAQQPITGYVLNNAGLMANLSLNGTKISPLNI